MTSILVWFITIVLMLLGVVGTLLPAIPGIGFVFAGILVYAIATQFATISGATVAIFGVIAVLTWLANYLGSVMGAASGGGKGKALIGTILGAIAGVIIGGPVAILIGAFIGALVGALIEGKTHQQATKVAIWSVVGIIGATLFQFLIAISMVIAFFIAVFI